MRAGELLEELQTPALHHAAALVAEQSAVDQHAAHLGAGVQRVPGVDSGEDVHTALPQGQGAAVPTEAGFHAQILEVAQVEHMAQADLAGQG